MATRFSGAVGTERIAKLIAVALADVNPPDSVMDAVITHVPVATKATRPVPALTVQIVGDVVANVIVPEPTPALGAAVIVGGVPERA